MNERAIFEAALDRTLADRSAYLDEVCTSDPALRERVEALLCSHERAGDFPGRLAPQRLADELAAEPESDDTRTGPTSSEGDEDLDFLAPTDRPDSLGRLGHYEVLEIVGRGGMGVVVRAFDGKLHRIVAVKVMAAQLATSATSRKRFTREARAAAAVIHDHVVTIHAVEEADPLPYIVMQYVAGVSLQERLDRTGPLPLREILRIGMQAASGLAAAHAQGLVHRDVKPANILLENGVERVKITDFGLARAADDASLTQSGAVAGTPQYMSPEQAEGKPVDHRSDLFSLGSVLYAMCTGRPPFRAASSMAVLKRVCEEMPTPVREANPDVPDWLVSAIERLHAKDPERRFQSAAEVAEVLGQHLAHLQQSSIVPLPVAKKPAAKKAAILPPARRHRWVAAAALVLLTAGLGLAEVAGVTKIRATVIRIFTPDGTLVVEADDPDVKIAIEGNGDLVITGAGVKEVRLAPGSYKLRATKDGQSVKLDRDLVTISRGDTQIVRARIEGAAPPTTPLPSGAQGEFVVVGGKGTEVGKFDNLADAVQRANDGDAIEIRGNGPFVTHPIKAGNRALTIRAASGFRPVIRLSREGGQTYEPMLQTVAALVLEGIEFQRPDQKPWALGQPGIYLIYATGSSVRVANCRFRGSLPDPNMPHLQVSIGAFSPVCHVRNCEFLSRTEGSIETHGKTVILDNCLHAGRIVMSFSYDVPGREAAEVRLTRNTLVTTDSQAIWFGLNCGSDRIERGPAVRPVRFDAAGNVLDVGYLLQVGPLGDRPKPLTSDQAEDVVPRVLDWKGRENVHRASGHLVLWSHGPDAVPDRGPGDLTSWKKFWNSPEAGSVEGRTRYRGGDLMARLAVAADTLTPDDFRLRPDSAGYRAGADGKDLGADVDLVGPGPAYERWKKTPEYQQWLKESGQVK